LGIELDELDDWNCCGASSAHSIDERLSIALPARNLAIAEKEAKDLIVPCAACYQRLKVAEKELSENPALLPEISYQGKVKVKHLLDFLTEEKNLKEIKEKLRVPLSVLKPACYYGCLTVRPPKVTGAKEYEDPQNMDELMTILGAEVPFWSYKTDCCGGSLVLTRPDIVKRLVAHLFEMAQEAGANCIVTGCPLCQTNLDTRQEEINQESGTNYYLPIFYFTELIGLAAGYRDTQKWFKRHLVDPNKLLTSINLI
jgi:heterodisulfide reductase subunit B